MNNIELSVIIVNFNGFKYTKKCLDSIYLSNTTNFEIIVVDNGSTDSSQELLTTAYGSKNNFKLINLDKNYGPAKARNIGVASANGKYIAFLDNDTEVDHNWATSALTFLKNNAEVGVLQCKLLFSKERNKIDYVGEYLGQNGFLVQRAITGEFDNGQYNNIEPILAAKSAGMFITREAFDAAGGFDDDYFIYVEETDLGWRVWLQGYKVLFFPESVVYHEFGTSSIILSKTQNNYNTKFHGCKNYILTLFKNLGTLKLITILPLHIFLWIGLAWFSLMKNQKQTFICIHKAIIWHIKNFKDSLIKRAAVQKSRVVSDANLFSILMKKRNISYFIEKATTIKKVGNAEGFIKQD